MELKIMTLKTEQRLSGFRQLQRILLYWIIGLAGFGPGAVYISHAAEDSPDPSSPVTPEGGSSAFSAVTPPIVDGKPVAVDFDFKVIDIAQINEVESTFVLEAVAAGRWMDSRLAFDPNELGTSRKVYLDTEVDLLKREIWWPQLMAINNVGNFEVGRQQITIESDGTVMISGRFSSRLKTPFDFRRFPWDSQTLIVRLQSFSWHAEQMKLHDQDISYREDFQLPEWTIEGSSAEVTEVKESRHPKPFSTATLEIQLHRNSGFYSWKVVLPVVAIVCMSWVVFWMSEERLARRAGISATGILTIVAYQFLVSESLPRVAYLTALDRILLLSFVVVAATAVLNVIVSTPEMQSSGRSKKIDGYCKILLPMGYLVGLVVAFASI